MKLPAIATQAGAYCLVELDDFDAIYKQFALTDGQSQSSLRTLLQQILTKEVSAIASGIILGPESSFYALEHKADQAGLLLSLEKKQASPQPTQPPQLVPDWSMEHVRNNYAVAALELYYNPAETHSQRKKQLVHELSTYAQHESIDFLLKLVTYPLAESDNLFELQFTALGELRTFADLIAVEYFEDPLHAATITTQLDVPWIVFERNVNYETAKNTLRVGLENGASGFIISDVLWHDFAKQLQGAEVTPELLEQYIKTTVRDRLLEMVRIANETSSS